MKKLFRHICLLPTLTLLLGPSADAVAAQPNNKAIVVNDLKAPVVKTAKQTLRKRTPLGSPQLKKAPTEIASLSFSWNFPVSAAVFKREQKLWIVFDRPQNVNIKELRRTAKNLATDIFQFPHPSATIITMTPKDNVGVSIRKEGLLWIIDLAADDASSPVKDLPVFTSYDSLQRPYLFIPAENNGNIVSAIDPYIGDIIQIAPLNDVGKGTVQPYHYPEFDMLNTYQGMAFIIKAGDISLNRGNTGVILKAEDRGINLSSDLDIKRRQQMYERQDNSDVFSISVLPQLLKENYNTALEQMRQDILKAPAEKKNAARLELVKFYLSHGLGTNALYILHQMQSAKIPESETDNFHALLGVANFLTKRYEEAIQNFEYGTLPQSDAAIFWRTLASSAQTYQPENNAVLQSFISLIQDYPQEIKDEIAVVAAKNALAAGDDIGAQHFIDILKSGTDRLRDRNDQIRYLSAKKVELQGYPRTAVKEYRELANVKSQKYSSLARYDNVILSQQLNIMPLPEAISELERLKFSWSEKRFKWLLQKQLALFYVKNNDYYNGIRTLENTLSLAETEEQKQELLDQMLAWFEDIYLNNQADTKMSAIKSLALYTDFEWLAEKSPRKHKIIQKLADRLVAVDLLPRAQNLLSELLEKEDLNDEDRAKAGVRLAVITLFEEKPDDALQIINDTATTENIPEELQAFRRVVKARALAKIGKTPEALQLLQDDFSKNALLLKTEIFWKSGQWSEASDTIKYLIERPTPGKPLSPEQMSYVLDWATTLKKAGKETVLVRLRNKFQPYFVNTNYYSTFNVLTEFLEADKVDIRKVNNIVNDVQAFSNFAKAYNDVLKNSDIK